MTQIELTNELAIDCFLLAGRLMMECGAETYRVEDTMLRMAYSQNMNEAQSYVTPTGIIFSLGRTHPTRIVSISNRTTDLHKITLVNAVSRKLTSKSITLEEAYDELKKIENTNYSFSIFVQIIAAAIASGCFLVLLGGMWCDVPAVMIGGGVGHFVVSIMQRLTHVKFFSEFTASFVIGVLAVLYVYLGLGAQLDKIIIGSVIPLVPGMIITNAVRDLMAGHFIAGMAKGAEAFITAFAIGSGIAVVLSF